MRIGLASDSYGNLDPLEKALELFGRAQVDRVFFLGGRVADVDAALVRRRRRASRGPSLSQSNAEFLAAVEGALSGQAAGEDPLASRIVRVASRTCPEYASGAVPRRQMDLVDGRIFCLVHDKAELSRDDISNATVLVHGNSGHAALVQIGQRYFVTPGALRGAPPADPPTFGMIEVTQRELVLTVFSAEGAELRQERASFSASGKMSVR